jgi:hypothetical protein
LDGEGAEGEGRQALTAAVMAGLVPPSTSHGRITVDQLSVV